MKKQSKIVLIWNSVKSSKSFSLSQGKLIGLTLIVVLVFAGITTIAINAFSNSFYAAKLLRLQKNNSKLVGTIYDMQNRIKQMESELHVLTEKDRALRTYADIPLIDKDVRKLGIGGRYNFQSDELDNLLLDFVNTKLELYNKLTEDKVNATLKRIWFNELYDRTVRGISI